jgi:acetyltransferase
VPALDPFLRPRGVAVVGASDRPTSSGGAVLQNLRAARFSGPIVPVNPKGGEYFGLPAATSLRAVGAEVDLIVVVVRPEAILDVIAEAAACGHKNLLILPGGFAEAGEIGRQRDAACRALAAQYGLTIAGPNCAGLINLLEPHWPFAATFLRDLPRGGGVAFVSQSGAIAEELIAASHSFGIPLGAVVSLGNGMHLGLADYVEHFGADPNCKAILLYAESFGDLAKFRAVARRVAAGKPIIALLGGRTAAGRAAALHHTGSEALDDIRAETLCRDCGVLRVTSLRRLMLAGKAFGALPGGIGERVLILSNSGGPGVLCADQVVLEGLQLPALPTPFSDALRAYLPAEAAIANPIDLLADAREDRFGTSFELAQRHGAGSFDAILSIHVVPFMVDAAPVVARVAELAQGAPLPLLACMMGTLTDKSVWFAHMESVAPMFNDIEDMAAAAGMLAAYPKLARSAREGLL